MSLIGSYSAKKDRKIYGNCQVFSPDGILMFRCDRKKVDWYLNKNLAEIISESPLSIKLLFKPKGLGNHNKSFGLTEMVNKCVNCGSEEFLTRHHVVPFCYRKHFPINLKSHNFHDVLSMCVLCHESYERKADKLKLNLSNNFNAPIGGITINSFDLKLIKIAKTLISENRIPKKRYISLVNEVKLHFKIKRLSKKKLKQISQYKSTTITKTHGEIVLQQIENLQEFIEMWRSHFIENNNCRFLPQNWNIKTILGFN